MMQLKTITRRGFMTGIFSAGAIGCLAKGTFYGSTAIIENDTNERVRALITVLEAFYIGPDCGMDEWQKANLRYSFFEIQPSNHLEETIAVAFGVSCMRELDVVDEYVRRKNGEASLLPDHQIFELAEWVVPDTRRLLIFREQVEALFGELTGSSLREGRELCKRALKPGMEKNELVSMLSDKYRDMDLYDIGTVCDAALFYAPYTISYQWCSTIWYEAHGIGRKDMKIKRYLD